MNRVIDFRQRQKYEKKAIVKPHIKYFDPSKAYIQAYNEPDNATKMLIQIRDAQNQEHHVEYAKQIIDLNNPGQNIDKTRGGIVDGLPLITDAQYLIWLFADNFYSAQGCGLTRIPFSTSHSITGGTKGSLATVTNINYAYQFQIGARCRIIQTNGSGPYYIGEWNLGTIFSIDSSTQIKVLLDNNANWGTNLSTNPGVKIEQLDYFVPYIATDSSQTSIYPNYYLAGLLETHTPVSTIEILRTFDWPLTKYDFYFYITPLYSQNISGSGSTTINTIGKYCPEEIKRINLALSMYPNAGATTKPYLRCFTSGSIEGVSFEGDVPNVTGLMKSQGYIALNADQLFSLNYYHSDVSIPGTIQLKGWEK